MSGSSEFSEKPPEKSPAESQEGSQEQPPRLLAWFFGRVLHPADRRFALADLEEEFERRATSDATNSTAVAGRWYRQQVLGSLMPTLRRRWDRAPRGILAGLADDLRYAGRSLVQAPVVAVVIVISSAVGIGVVTATFAAVNAFVRPPSDAIADPEGLVAIFTSDTDGGLYGRNSYLDFESLGGRVEAIEALASHRLGIVRFEADDSTSQLMAEIVSGNYFRVLGVEMALGRGFLDSEAVVGSADAVAVVSHRLWQEELGGTPDVLGSIQRIDGREFVVIGVAP